MTGFEHSESGWSKSDQLYSDSSEFVAVQRPHTIRHNVRNRKAHFFYFLYFIPSHVGQFTFRRTSFFPEDISSLRHYARLHGGFSNQASATKPYFPRIQMTWSIKIEFN